VARSIERVASRTVVPITGIKISNASVNIFTKMTRCIGEGIIAGLRSGREAKTQVSNRN
jgi:hypothetical protein